MKTATEQAAADETPLPTTPIGGSTSLGPRQVQTIPDKDSTPIRATTTFDEEATKDKEKGKSKSSGQTEKRKRVRFESQINPRKSSRIRGAKRTERLRGGED